MTNTTTFADVLAAANETKTGRSPGQWTPAVCRVWREAEPEAARLLEAALAWELAVGRRATPADGRGDGSGEGEHHHLKLPGRCQWSLHSLRLEFQQDNDAHGDG